MIQVNLDIDEDVKANAEKALNEMGLTLATAINIFLVRVAREGRIPFEFSVDQNITEK